MLVLRFADVQSPLSLDSMFKAQYKCQVIIIIIYICNILQAHVIDNYKML